MPGLTTAFAQGLAANRPAAAASNAGFYWLSTDQGGGTLYQSTGSTWVQVAGAVNAATSVTTKGDLQGYDTAANRVPVGTNGQVLTADSTQALGLKWAAAGAASLSTVSAQLGAAVTMTTANTWYDGPSVVVAAGTWLLIAAISYTHTGETGDDISAKLWDGTTVAASGGLARATAGGGASTRTVTLAAIVSPTGSTTYKISATSDNNGGTIDAAVATNGAGNNASWIVGIKVA